MKPFFSVIIPAYNCEETIGETIDSVINQSFKDFEIIVVDDGSTDKTHDIVRRYGFVTYLIQENRGPGAARNFGARIACGDYLIFLDSDDILFPWALEIYNSLMIDKQKIAFFGGSTFEFDNNTQIGSVSREPIDSRYWSNFLDAAIEGVYVGSGMMGVRRDVFVEVGGFNEKVFNAEDFDLTYRMGLFEGFFFVSRPYLVGYRNRANSLSRNAKGSFSGLRFIFEQVKNKAYSDDFIVNQQLWKVFALHARSNSISLKKNGYFKEAYWLYKRSFFVNLRLCRLKYLIGFWFV